MGKRLGIFIFDNAEVIDWATPTGVFAVARRMDPELETFLIGDTQSPVVASAWDERAIAFLVKDLRVHLGTDPAP